MLNFIDNKRMLAILLIFSTLPFKGFCSYDIPLTNWLGIQWEDPFASDKLETSFNELEENDNFTYFKTDFKILGKGKGSNLNLEFTRYYDNKNNKLGVCGYGWTTNLDASLQVVGDVAVFKDENGNLFSFQKSQSSDVNHPDFIPKSTPNPFNLYGVGMVWIIPPYTWRWDSLVLQKKYGNKYYFNYVTKLLQKIEDRNGNVISYNRDSNGKVISISDSSGRLITFTYNSENLLEKATDPAGNEYKYTYINDNLITVQNPLGYSVNFSYDYSLDVHNITKITNPRGNYMEIEYTSADRVLRYLQNGIVTWSFVYNDSLGLKNSTNSIGLSTTREFLNNGKTSRITDNFGVEENIINNDGYLIQYKDKNNNITSFERDVKGNVVNMTNARGNLTQITFDLQFSRPLNMLSPMDISQNFEYDLHGNLIKFTNSEGKIHTIKYSESGLPVELKDPKSNIYLFEYDSYGNLKKIIEPNLKVIEMNYDLLGNKISQKNEAGFTTFFEYDSLNRRKKIIHPDGSFTERFFDEIGNIIQIVNEEGNSSYSTYGVWEKPINVTDPEGNIWQYVYDSMGRQISRIDPMGNQYNLEYDALDRIIKLTYPDGTYLSYAYSAQSNSKVSEALGQRPISSYDAKGNITQYEYNQLYAMTREIDPFGSSNSYEYDEFDRLVKIKNKLGQDTLYSYNTLKQVTNVENYLGDKKYYNYDANGNMVASTDFNGNTTSYIFDKLDRVISIKDAKDQVTSFSYDEIGNISKVTDPKGNHTYFEYDFRNRLKKETDDSGNNKQYSYNSLNWITKIVEPNGSEINFTYYKHGLIKEIIYSETKQTKYFYDQNLNLIKTVDWNGTTLYSYNNLNQLISKRLPDGKTINTNYDEKGHQASVQLLNNNQSELYNIYYEFDAIDRLTKVSDDQNNYIEFNYNPLDQILNKNLSNGSTVSYEYSVRNFLKNKEVKNSLGNTIFNLTFERDKEANVLNEQNQTGITKSYQYDSNYQLLQANYSNGYSFNYSYDAAGNILTKTVNGVTSTYSYNNLNQLTSSTDGAGVTNYNYDPNGRIISETSSTITTSYLYNELGLVSSIINTGESNDSVNYKYDSQMNRIEKILSTGDTSTYTYDESQNLLMETFSGSSENAFYISDKIDEKLLRVVNGSTRFYLLDNINSLRGTLSNSQNLHNQLTYEPYGSLISGSPENHTHLFTGREKDINNLYYYRNRLYSPKLGRFLQKDPIGLEGGINQYQYVKNNPLNLIDPHGFDGVKPGPEDPQGDWFPDPEDITDFSWSAWEQDQQNEGTVVDGQEGEVNWGKKPGKPDILGPSANIISGYFGGNSTGLVPVPIPTPYGMALGLAPGVGLGTPPIMQSKPGKLVGGKKGQRDQGLRGLSNRFKKWFHRQWKPRNNPKGNSSYDQIKDAYEEWLERGQPDEGTY